VAEKLFFVDEKSGNVQDEERSIAQASHHDN